MAMKIEGGPPSPPPQVDTTKATEATQQTDAKSSTEVQQESNKSTTTTYDKSGQVAEHSLAGQARAAQLKTQTETGPGGTTGMTKPKEPTLSQAQGSKGPEVETLQHDLNQWRGANGKAEIKEDGKFGPKTDVAVKDFQKANGLKADGIVGPNTKDRLSLENDESFKTLPDATKKTVRDSMNGYSKDQVSRDQLKQLATDPNFSKISPDAQDAALKKLAANSQDPATLQNIQDNVKDRAAVETNANFKTLNTETQKKVLTQLDSYPNDAASRANVTSLATDPNFGKLSPGHQEQALKVLSNNSGDQGNVDNLKKMIGSDSFLKMDDALKTRTLDMAATNAANTKYTGDLAKLTSDPKYGAMSTQDKAKTLNVFENTTPNGRDALIALMQKDIKGTPALLNKDSQGKTTLDNLDRLAKGTMDARVADGAGTPANKARVSEDLLKELSNPSQNVNQHNRGTCTVTSMSYNLANQNPAEYARLVTDLSTTGKAKLANGDTITPPADAFIQDNSNRSVGERLLQSSLMNYATGGNYQNWNAGADGVRGTPDDGFPDPTNPNSRSLDGVPPNGSGLDYDQQVKVLSALTNKKYEHYDGSWNFRDDKVDILEKSKDQLKAGNGPVYTRVEWAGGGHAIEVTKIENGRVYFRNPWGGNIPGVSTGVGPTDPVGPTPNRNPPRRVEDGPNGIESMTIDDYKKHVRGVIIQD